MLIKSWQKNRTDLSIKINRDTFAGTISGADPGFKKIAPSRGRRENFLGISCEKSRFYAKKNHIFTNFRGARAGWAPPLPWIHPCTTYKSVCEWKQNIISFNIVHNCGVFGICIHPWQWILLSIILLGLHIFSILNIVEIYLVNKRLLWNDVILWYVVFIV